MNKLDNLLVNFNMYTAKEAIDEIIEKVGWDEVNAYVIGWLFKNTEYIDDDFDDGYEYLADPKCDDCMKSNYFPHCSKCVGA